MTTPKFQGRLIARQTYKNFMKKYKLRVTEITEDGKRKPKTIAQMRNEIYKYETETTDDIVDGLYYNVPS